MAVGRGDHDDTLVKQPLEQSADDHGIGNVGDLHLVQAQQRRVPCNGIRDHRDRVRHARLAGDVDRRMDLLHQRVEMDSAARRDRRMLDEQIHQHRFPPSHPTIEVEAGNPPVLHLFAAPTEQTQLDRFRGFGAVSFQAGMQKLQLFHRKPLRGVVSQVSAGDHRPVLS